MSRPQSHRRRTPSFWQITCILLFAYGVALIVWMAWDARDIRGGLPAQMNAALFGGALYSYAGEDLLLADKGWSLFGAKLAAIVVLYAFILFALALIGLFPRAGIGRALVGTIISACLLVVLTAGVFAAGNVWLLVAPPLALYLAGAIEQLYKAAKPSVLRDWNSTGTEEGEKA